MTDLKAQILEHVHEHPGVKVSEVVEHFSPSPAIPVEETREALWELLFDSEIRAGDGWELTALKEET